MALLVLRPLLTAEPLSLAGAEPPPIVVSPAASPVEHYAAEELARCLGKMTGREFILQSVAGQPPAQALLVGPAFAADLGENLDIARLGDDAVRLKRQDGRILIAGAGPRGTLDAVYVFLERLGCRWFAPNFAFYGAAGGEHIPRVGNPQIDELDVTQRPSFRWRKKYVEEGVTHDLPTLLAMIDWMAKVRLNVLDCPINYQGLGRTKWDNWRTALIPELHRRGILIEVGGHGYQNFLPAARYFAAHPDWFGMFQGKRTDDPRVVFSTANPAAVDAFLGNIRAYLREHPEIDIFDCWPPDSARWSEAPEDVALGSPTERQMILLNRVAADLGREFPRLRVQFLAYSSYVEPPREHRPAAGVEMEFCPINRGFQTRLYDPQQPQNADYYRHLQAWLGGVMAPESVTIYTYITKYAWRSLPVLVPHLIADEAGHFAKMGLGGFSSYSEPGAWAALELDHYFLARYSWDARLDADQELRDYAAGRYGPAAGPALEYLRLAEAVVPRAVAIPGSDLKAETQKRYLARFEQAGPLIAQARRLAAGDPEALAAIDKLDGARRYALNEIELRLAFLQAGTEERSGQLDRIAGLLEERRNLMAENRSRGLLVVDQRTK